MFLDSLELRYGALGGAARGGENKSSNRTCSPNKRTPPRDRARRNWQTRRRRFRWRRSSRYARKKRSRVLSDMAGARPDLTVEGSLRQNASNISTPRVRTAAGARRDWALRHPRRDRSLKATPLPARPEHKDRSVKDVNTLRLRLTPRQEENYTLYYTGRCRGGVVSPGPRGSPEIGLVEARLALARGPGPGCSPSCSAARNSINSAPSSAARSSAMRFLAMCPTTASPS